MNAAILYTQLSREVLNLQIDCSDEKFNDFMKHDRGFFKLRSMLLCRACRKLCNEPFSSSFCEHLVCKQCLEEKKGRNPGCKWCRCDEDLVADLQSKILIGLYKQLCAILREIVTGFIAIENTDQPRTSSSTDNEVKEKLIIFINEGCSLPDFVSPLNNKETVTKKEKYRLKSQSISKPEPVLCPPCCCSCSKNDNIKKKENLIPTEKNITHEQPVKFSDTSKDPCKSPDYASDRVSSTVPDSISSQDKNHKITKNGSKDAQKNYNTKEEATSDKVHNKLLPSMLLEKLSTVSRKKRKNRNIFEKFGLALTPSHASGNSDADLDYSEKLKRKKLHQEFKEKKKKNITSNESPPKVQPLKLTVQKINTPNNDGSYKIQYNITSSQQETSNIDPDNTGTQDSSISKIDLSDLRKTKRKATFITNYNIFSDDSDFETDDFKNKKKVRRSVSRKENKDVCGCGAGSNVKYFTDICKRSRCPCYAQGRACVNCKCRFCSNPFLLDDEFEEVYSDSDVSTDKPLSNWSKDECEVVDVEAV